jgi:hypothetical protein
MTVPGWFCCLPATYVLSKQFRLNTTSTNLTLDASSVGGATLVAASNTRHFSVTSGATFIARGITFRGGRLTGTTTTSPSGIFTSCGGSIFVNASSAYFYKCTFALNTAWTGAAVYVASSRSTDAQSIFYACNFLYNTMTSTVFATSITAPVYCGGALALYGWYDSNTASILTYAFSTIVASTFSFNTGSSGAGGALNAYFAYVTMSETTFTSNMARVSGAIEQTLGFMYGYSNTYSSNYATFGIGAYRCRKGTAYHYNSTYLGNYVTAGVGGAVSSWTGGVVTWSYSTFVANSASGTATTAGRGGAVYVYRATATLNYCTVGGSSALKNTATVYGGGVYVDDGGSLISSYGSITSNTQGTSSSTGGDIYAISSATVVTCTCTRTSDNSPTSSCAYAGSCTPSPTMIPSLNPSTHPTTNPTRAPPGTPTRLPSNSPTVTPTTDPTSRPSQVPLRCRCVTLLHSF